MSYRTGPISIFSGRSNPELAKEIAKSYGRRLGEVSIKNFSDGELYVKYQESIRGADLYIIQSTHPPAENWLELFMMIDAAKRASAAQVTAVIPYFGYARQERKDQPRVSITAKLMANMLVTAGADRVLTMDLHAPQIQGFFDIPVDHLYGASVFDSYLKSLHIPDLVIVAPDLGSSKMARAYANRLNADLAIIDKRRPEQNAVEVMHIIGNVKDKNVIILDDMADTAGTLTKAAEALVEAGAKEIRAATTHAVLSGPAYERIEKSPIKEFIVTNTIPVHKEKKCKKLKVISVADAFADAIRRIYTDESISSLFID